jgi:diguanylate cyclase
MASRGIGGGDRRTRRVGDNPATRLSVLGARLRAVEAATDGLAPVFGGQVLLVATGLPAAVAAPLLQPDSRGWATLGVVSGAMLVALLVSAFLPWHRLPSAAALLFPGLVCAGLAGLEAVSPGRAAALTGVLVLCYAYVGLAHPAGTSLLVLPVASITFVFVNGGWTMVTSVRLVLLAMIWILLAELLARQARRQRVLSQALRTAAHTDVLTGVGNRREVDLRLVRAEPGDVVVLCDLDHFKALNDSRGHLVGDRVLADFGALLRTELRAHDFAGRFGGEEFLLLLTATTDGSAARVLVRLREGFAEAHPAVTFSSGRSYIRRGRTVDDTLAAADAALYAAKAEGRDTDRAEPPQVPADGIRLRAAAG